MNCEPILCNGNDLEATLNGLRKQRMVPWALDAMVKTNAGYTVSYFERVRGAPSGLTVAAGDQPGNAGALSQFEHVEESVADSGIENDDGRLPPRESSERDRDKSLIGANPIMLRPLPHQCETPASLLATVAVKSAVAPRIPIIGVKIPSQTPALTQRPCVTSHPQGNGGAEAVGVDSISTRLAALQSKLAASGKLRRSKTREARLPHND